MDSIRVLDEAKDAQRAFEQFHRGHLPEASEDWTQGCDENVGGLCVRFSSALRGPENPEDSIVVQARLTLLEKLAELRCCSLIDQ